MHGERKQGMRKRDGFNRILPLPRGEAWGPKYAAMRVTDGEWYPIEGYVCRWCGGTAYRHPYTQKIWGCKACGYTSASLYIHFATVDEARRTGAERALVRELICALGVATVENMMKGSVKP